MGGSCRLTRGFFDRHTLDDPRREGCCDNSDETDPADHQQHGNNSAGVGNRVDVAVADGGHRCDRPPQRLSEGVDDSAVLVSLLVEHG